MKFFFYFFSSYMYWAREWDPITSGHWRNTWRHMLPDGNLCAELSTCDRITDVKTRWARETSAHFLTLVRDNWMLFSAAVCWFDVSLLGWTQRQTDDQQEATWRKGPCPPPCCNHSYNRIQSSTESPGNPYGNRRRIHQFKHSINLQVWRLTHQLDLSHWPLCQ